MSCEYFDLLAKLQLANIATVNGFIVKDRTDIPEKPLDLNEMKMMEIIFWDSELKLLELRLK